MSFGSNIQSRFVLLHPVHNTLGIAQDLNPFQFYFHIPQNLDEVQIPLFNCLIGKIERCATFQQKGEFPNHLICVYEAFEDCGKPSAFEDKSTLKLLKCILSCDKFLKIDFPFYADCLFQCYIKNVKMH